MNYDTLINSVCTFYYQYDKHRYDTQYESINQPSTTKNLLLNPTFSRFQFGTDDT